MITLQVGYMNIFQQLAAGNKYRSNHVARVFYFHNLDLRKIIMARIEPPLTTEISPSVKDAFERHVQEYGGRITNMKATLGHSLYRI